MFKVSFWTQTWALTGLASIIISDWLISWKVHKPIGFDDSDSETFTSIFLTPSNDSTGL